MLKSFSCLKSLNLCAFVVGLFFVGCSVGDSGIVPPFDQIFLPAGLVADPSADLLYVVNSNSDLRYNAGTLVPVDMAEAWAMREKADNNPNFKACSKTRFSRTEQVVDDFCCWDLVDSNILNCNEKKLIHSQSTVQIGSFGGQIELQEFQLNGELIRRLYVLVRAEPSVTFADVAVVEGVPIIQCTGARGSQINSGHLYCDDNWRIRRPSGSTTGSFQLAEEPHVLAMDKDIGALYVGHLTVNVNTRVEGGGISTIDICHPEQDRSPQFAGRSKVVFPDQFSQAVIGLSDVLPLKSDLRVFATARFSSEISGMVFRFPPAACKPEEGSPVEYRDLSLIPSDSFLSSAFLPYGKDIRGILFSSDENTAYVLHRNASENVSNPSALVAIDRRRQADGTRTNRPIDILKLCNGPTAMKYYPAEGERRQIFVTCYDEGQIYVVDPEAWQVDAVIDVGLGPNSLIFPMGRENIAYVASYAGNHVAIIDLDPQSPTRNRVVQRLGLPHGNSE